jgi:hypothetical protein
MMAGKEERNWPVSCTRKKFLNENLIIVPYNMKAS